MRGALTAIFVAAVLCWLARFGVGGVTIALFLGGAMLGAIAGRTRDRTTMGCALGGGAGSALSVLILFLNTGELSHFGGLNAVSLLFGMAGAGTFGFIAAAALAEIVAGAIAGYKKLVS